MDIERDIHNGRHTDSGGRMTKDGAEFGRIKISRSREIASRRPLISGKHHQTNNLLGVALIMLCPIY
jgi:hypothetical protein